MEGFLRFIFVAVLIYYGFKIAVRYIMPWVLTRFVKKQQEKFNNMNNYSNYNTNTNNDIHVKTKSNHTHTNDTDFGEYVDFEDVDD